ncbi:MAG: hypothetical protein WC600_08275 [Desulfobaccales bacterium]
MGVSEFFESFWKGIQGEQTVLKFYHRIPDQQILPDGFTSQVFRPNESYFEIRLAEMFLASRRQYWQGFIPLGIILSDFLYNRQRQSVPFLVGNQLLKGLEQSVGGEYVEYYNTRIAGPVPYIGDDVGLFVGLFRSKVEDLSEGLFSFLETLIGAFDLGQIKPYLKIAGQVRTGLGHLLRLPGEKVQYRLGNRDTFVDPTLKPEDAKKFREGYLAYINCPEDALDRDSLRVKEDRLQVQTATTLEPLRSYDYCLIRLESLPARNDYTTFPWYDLWLQAVDRIYHGDITGATIKLMDFNQKVRQSPDLTEGHQYKLIAMFQGNFDKEVEIAGLQKGGQVQRAPTVNRGDSGQQLEAKVTLQRTASLAQRAGLGKEKQAVKVLWDIHKNWGRIPYLTERPEEFDWRNRKEDEDINRLINDQLKEVGEISKVSEPDPQGLADALMAAYLSPDLRPG